MKQYNYDIYDSAGKIGLDVQTGWEGVGCRGTGEKCEITDAVNGGPYLTYGNKLLLTYMRHLSLWSCITNISWCTQHDRTCFT
jgi:hypothetical protein